MQPLSFACFGWRTSRPTIGSRRSRRSAFFAHDDYAFLGMRFFHAASASERSLGPIVSIAEKTALKLRRARAILATRSPLATVDLQAIFGVCIFGSIVVGYEMFRVYFIFKFMRKLVSKIRRNADLARRAMVWPAIVDQWCAWIDSLLLSSFSPRPSPLTTWTVYTDASDVGCGVVVFLSDRTLFWARAWSPAERLTFINERELLAVLIASFCRPTVPVFERTPILILLLSCVRFALRHGASPTPSTNMGPKQALSTACGIFGVCRLAHSAFHEGLPVALDDIADACWSGDVRSTAF
jgi:hypothetical protein